MAGKQQAVQVQNKQSRQPKVEPSTEKIGEGPSYGGAWFAGLAVAPSNWSAGGQPDLLGNGQIQRAQLIALASQVGRMQGNQYLQRYIDPLIRHTAIVTALSEDRFGPNQLPSTLSDPKEALDLRPT